MWAKKCCMCVLTFDYSVAIAQSIWIVHGTLTENFHFMRFWMVHRDFWLFFNNFPKHERNSWNNLIHSELSNFPTLLHAKTSHSLYICKINKHIHTKIRTNPSERCISRIGMLEDEKQKFKLVLYSSSNNQISVPIWQLSVSNGLIQWNVVRLQQNTVCQSTNVPKENKLFYRVKVIFDSFLIWIYPYNV